ncbi:MAG: hypothetical protein ACQESP_00960 [Candidatus Muiribacteriota bacterium]
MKKQFLSILIIFFSSVLIFSFKVEFNPHPDAEYTLGEISILLEEQKIQGDSWIDSREHTVFRFGYPEFLHDYYNWPAYYTYNSLKGPDYFEEDTEHKINPSLMIVSQKNIDANANTLDQNIISLNEPQIFYPYLFNQQYFATDIDIGNVDDTDIYSWPFFITKEAETQQWQWLLIDPSSDHWYEYDPQFVTIDQDVLVRPLSSVFDRTYSFYTVLESPHGMAYWKDLTLNTELFFNVEPTPCNPSMHPGSHPNIVEAGNEEATWIRVNTDGEAGAAWQHKNYYPPYSSPVTGASNRVNWNIRMWVYATNDEDKINLDWFSSDSFQESFYQHTYLGDIIYDTATTNDRRYSNLSRIYPVDVLTDITFDPFNPDVALKQEEISLVPRDYEGLLDNSQEYDSSTNTYNVTYNLENIESKNEVGDDIIEDPLYGRFLLVFFQVYPYDRYVTDISDLPFNHYLPKQFNYSDKTHYQDLIDYIEFQIPSDYTWVTNMNDELFLDPNDPVRDFSDFPVSGNIGMPPLTSVPLINSVEAEFDIVQFDVFVDPGFGGGDEYSTDNVTQYFEWRAIQNFMTGTYETGSIVRRSGDILRVDD